MLHQSLVLLLQFCQAVMQQAIVRLVVDLGSVFADTLVEYSLPIQQLMHLNQALLYLTKNSLSFVQVGIR